MSKHKFFFSIAALFTVVCFKVCMVSSANATNIVYPDDPNWILDLREEGNAEISAENPRSGNASLALTTSGLLTDWAFYSRYADNSWGLLSDISAISFDWYRESLDISEDYENDIPWLAQTPVLRLLIRDEYQDNYFNSELVWEKYYTDNSPAITNTWVTQNMLDDNYWRYVPGDGYTIFDGTNIEDFSPNPLMAKPLSLWALSDGVYDYPYTSNAVVYGLSVGVGSAWPDNYSGYVDNVLLSFTNNEKVIDDNFELPVPEPATLLLLGSGLAILAVRTRWRIRRLRH